ncbi:hypothetical protein [Sphingomonas sp. CLY1604]|uniref:hypothetical protein n=1 Tax=Sphingomonas sp. CLY1604 TaxID=3457786 RepID=UPI003FD7353A
MAALLATSRKVTDMDISSRMIVAPAAVAGRVPRNGHPGDELADVLLGMSDAEQDRLLEVITILLERQR